MRRRPRIDLGQGTSERAEERLDQKRARWAEINKHLNPEDNPFLKAVKPDQEQYGDPEEQANELRARLKNLEFGNFPGYFNYRNKAALEKTKNKTNDDSQNCGELSKESGDNNHQQTHHVSTQEARSLEAGLTDERLNYLKKEWFHQKSILDIGCNRGHITYAIARLFSPNSIVGIDIDLKMVTMANKDLHLYLEKDIIKEARESRLKRAAKLKLENADSYSEPSSQFPLSSYVLRGPLAVCGRIDDADLDEESRSFPNNIVFMEHNYVVASDELVAKQEPKFDTILCLSVTKWVHLNYRDDGLKRFFKRIYNHLKPEGLLILEAQPFDNYGRRRKLSDRLKSNYYSIQFKPDQFDEYLLSEQVGFKEIIYESVTDHQCAGFKRPLKVFLK